MGPSFIHRVVHRLSTGRNLSQIPVMQRSTWCGPLNCLECCTAMTCSNWGTSKPHSRPPSCSAKMRRDGSRPISPSCRLLDASLRDLFRVQRCDVDPATTDPCFRKPSLIACLIPSSINVLATSGTLVPWVPSLDSWSKNPQVPTARVTGRRSVSAINQRHR